MKNCIIPGSFDPVTAGHVSLFETAAKLFDRVYPVILVNSEKSGGLFTYEQRFEILKAAVDKMHENGTSNVEAVLFKGLTTDAALELDSRFIVKGVRNLTDFAYEYDLSQITLRFEPSVETVLLPSRADLACVSSTYVRELIKYSRFDSDDFAEGTTDLIKKFYNR